jgi:hypothetical protein
MGCVGFSLGLVQIGLHIGHAGFQDRKDIAMVSQVFQRTRRANLHGAGEVL